MEEESEPRPFGVIAAVLWCLTATLLMTLVAVLIDGARPGASSDLVTLTLSRIVAVSIVLFAIARVHSPTTPLREMLGISRPKPVFFVIAVFLGLSLCVVLNWLDARVAAALPPDEADTELVEKVLSTPTAFHKIFLVFAFMIALPACHELLFRGATFTGLRGTRPLMDAAITTVLLEVALTGGFIDKSNLPSTIGFAVCATYLRAASGSVIPTFIAHSAFYASVLAVVWKPTWVDEKTPPAILAIAAVIAAISIVAIRFFALPAAEKTKPLSQP